MLRLIICIFRICWLFIFNHIISDFAFVKVKSGNGQAVVSMSVTVRLRGEKQLLVRANAQYGVVSVDDPATYQDFFAALEKAIFLTAQQVD